MAKFKHTTFKHICIMLFKLWLNKDTELGLNAKTQNLTTITIIIAFVMYKLWLNNIIELWLSKDFGLVWYIG